jgi:hypothetical protein
VAVVKRPLQPMACSGRFVSIIIKDNGHPILVRRAQPLLKPVGPRATRRRFAPARPSTTLLHPNVTERFTLRCMRCEVHRRRPCISPDTILPPEPPDAQGTRLAPPFRGRRARLCLLRPPSRRGHLDPWKNSPLSTADRGETWSNPLLRGPTSGSSKPTDPKPSAGSGRLSARSCPPGWMQHRHLAPAAGKAHTT